MTDTTPGKLLDDALTSLRADIKADMKSELAALRADVKADMKAEVAVTVRAETASLRADIKADMKSEVTMAVKAEMTAVKDEILSAINGGIDRLRTDLNTEFAKHKIPVKLATAPRNRTA